jgi:hypothetical protein
MNARLESHLKGLVQRVLSVKGYESKMSDPSVNSLTAAEAEKEIRWALGGGKKFALFQDLAKLALDPEKTLDRLKPTQIEELAESIVGPVQGINLGQAALAGDIPSKAKSMVDETKQTILTILTMLRQSRHPKIQLLIRHIVAKLKRTHPDLARRLAAVPRAAAAIKNQEGGGMKLLYAVVLLGFLAHILLLGSGSIEPMLVFDFAVLTRILSFLKLTSGLNPEAMYPGRTPYVLAEAPPNLASGFKIGKQKEDAAKLVVETQEENALAGANLRKVAGSVMRLKDADMFAGPLATGVGALLSAEQGASEAARSIAGLEARSRQTAAELKVKKAETIFTMIFGLSDSAQEDIKQLERIYNETQADIARNNATLAVAGGAPSLTRASDVLAVAAASATQIAGIIATNPELINPGAIGPPLVAFLESSVKATTELEKSMTAIDGHMANATSTLADLRGEIEEDAARLAEVDADVDRLTGVLSGLYEELRVLEGENLALPQRIKDAKAAANAKWSSLSTAEARAPGAKSNAYRAWEELDAAQKGLEARRAVIGGEIAEKTREVSRAITERTPVEKEQGMLIRDIGLNRAKVVTLEADLARYGPQKAALQADLANAQLTGEAVKSMQGRIAAIADGDADRGTVIPKGAVTSYTVDPSTGAIVSVGASADMLISANAVGTGGLFKASPGSRGRSGGVVSFSAEYPGLGQLSTVMNPSLPMTGSLQEALGSLTALINAESFTGAIVRASENEKPVDPDFGKKVVASFGGEGELSVPGRVASAVAQALHTEIKLEQAEQAFEALEGADSYMKQEAAVRVFKKKAREITDAYMGLFGPAYPELNRTTVEGHVNHFLTVIITEFQAFPKEGSDAEIAAILETAYVHPPKERPSDFLTHEEVMAQMNIHKDKWTRVLYRLDKAKWDLVVTGLLGGLAVILSSLPTGFARILSNLFERANVGIEGSTAAARARANAEVARIRAGAARAGSPGGAAAAAAPAPGRPRTGSRWGPAHSPAVIAARLEAQLQEMPPGFNRLSLRTAARRARAASQGHGGGGRGKTRKQILRRRRSTRRA